MYSETLRCSLTHTEVSSINEADLPSVIAEATEQLMQVKAEVSRLTGRARGPGGKRAPANKWTEILNRRAHLIVLHQALLMRKGMFTRLRKEQRIANNETLTEIFMQVAKEGLSADEYERLLLRAQRLRDQHLAGIGAPTLPPPPIL